ncbi:MAG: hypothetical protein WBA05_02680 [Gordonia sp. (in: high G+C Gram-positive bacteria)]|uniref:hypothetical protein n=1 Tax=Gordonia TaxID=2053 RepID=UPI003264E97D
MSEPTKNEASTDAPLDDRKARILQRMFDIRNIVGALLVVYGVILLIGGLLPATAEAGAADRAPSSNPIDMSVGTSANIWVGLILALFGVLFLGWAAMRPTNK